jgi:hypothetical protein
MTMDSDLLWLTISRGLTCAGCLNQNSQELLCHAYKKRPIAKGRRGRIP